MNRTAVIVTLAAIFLGIGIGYFVMSSGGIMSKPGGGVMNTPHR